VIYLHFQSLNKKFIFAICVICIFCLIIVSSISYIIAYEIIKNEVNHRTFESVTKYANEFNTWFVDQGRIVHEMVEAIEINGNFSRSYLANFFSEKLKREDSNIINYFMGFTDQKIGFVDGLGWQPPEGYDCRKRQWFSETIDNNRLTYTNSYIDAVSKKMVVSVTKPVKRQGQVIGVAGVDILLTDLMDLVQKAKMERADYAFLLDNKQNFLAHPDESFHPGPGGLINAAQALDGLYRPLVKQISAKKFESIEFKDYDGIQRFFFFAPIKSAGWTFSVGIDKSEYLKSIDKLWIGFSIALVLSLLVGIIIIRIMVKDLLKPIIKLQEAVIKYSHNDFRARSPVLSRDEVGELSESFNYMADIIQRHNETLQQRVEDRTRQLREINERIMQSIDYAHRIQLSILPNIEDVLDISPEKYFVIFKPRDVVGGDFYWCKRQKNNYFIAVADCTGHGVPGAMMTMTVNAILNQIADKALDNDPAKILQELNKLLKKTLRQDNPEALTDDGVDIGLCLIKPEENKLIFSGAKISLIVARKGHILEIKGNRHSIGYKRSKNDYEFTNHEIEFTRGNTCYLTTDGLPDQNGPHSDLGMGMKEFMRIISQGQGYSLPDQKNYILETLGSYMGGESQRDDITVLGLKY
jgi:serine phosphatase RsbU (regulator of sigma subunit)